MTRTTMSALSYGINTPVDLLEKLRFDAAKLTADSHPYDVFNFVITVAVLQEWCKKVYKGIGVVDQIMHAVDKRDCQLLPEVSSSWIVDIGCLPNKYLDVRHHIMNALRICWETANASKHYHWVSTSGVDSIGPEPVIDDWYKYFFTSVEPDLFIEYSDENYGLTQLARILVQFYSGLLTVPELSARDMGTGEVDWP